MGFRPIALVLILLANGDRAHAQTDYDDYASGVVARLGPEDADRLKAWIRARPIHTSKFVYEHLWLALRTPPSDPRPLDAARKVAAASGREELADAVRAHVALEGDRLAWALEFQAVHGEALRAAEANDWAAVAEHCLSAVDLAVAAELPYLEQRARRFAAEAFLRSGDRTTFREEIVAVLALDVELDLGVDEIIDREWLARVEFEDARWNGAEQQYLKAIELARAADQERLTQRLSLEVAAAYSVQGAYPKARTLLERRLVANEKLQDASASIETLERLAHLESALGRYDEAIANLERAIQSALENEQQTVAARLSADVAGVFSEIGRTKEAEDAIQRALAWIPAGHESEAAVRLTHGLVALDAGRTAEAVAIFAATLEHIAEPWRRAYAQRLYGMALLEAGDAEKARVALESALEFPSGAFESALAWSLLGDAMLVLDEIEAAQRAFAKALVVAEPIGSREATWRARAGLGVAHERSGDLRQALEHYEAAIDDIESIRSVLVAPELRVHFLDRKRELYVRAARVFAETGDLEGAFRMSSAAKARTLLETLGGGEASATLTEEARGWAAKLSAAESDLRMIELRLGQSPPTASVREALLANRNRARAERERARIGMRSSDPRGTALSGLDDALTLAQLRARLPQRAALIEYLVGDSGVSAFVVRTDGSGYHELHCREDELLELSQRLHGPIHDLRDGRIDAANLRFDVRAARRLHALLIEPLRGDLDDVEQLWIVADGAVRGLSFATLVSAWERRPVNPAKLYAQYEGCRFLVEEFAIGYLPTSSLLSEAVGKPADVHLLVVADARPTPAGSRPLSGARQEAHAFAANSTKDDVRTLIGKAATEAAVKHALAGPNVLHFATHGVLDNEQPMYSRLALAPTGHEDGWLHAFEIERTQVRGRVTLSACETLARLGRAEGLLGLTRAFLSAGADSVLASLWAVDDEATAQLMATYATQLAEGRDALAALREAQRATLRGGKHPNLSYAHPFFWGAFLHVGAP